MTDLTISTKIKKWIKDIETCKKKDPVCKELQKTIKESGDQIGYAYGKIHNEEYTSQEELNEIMMTISNLAEKKRTAEHEYKELMQTKFKDFKENYENIYELATSEEGIDQQTLNHVLKVFSQYQQNKITKNQGINTWVDYATEKYKLPPGFLNHVPDTD